MSLRDLDSYRGVLESFKGQSCFATLATNSIHLRIGDREKRGRYIWIDPPWVFLRGWQEISPSEAYSEDSFREWCGFFGPLRATVLAGFTEGTDGSLNLLFSDDYRLQILADFGREDDTDFDYDHWYACDKRS